VGRFVFTLQILVSDRSVRGFEAGEIPPGGGVQMAFRGNQDNPEKLHVPFTEEDFAAFREILSTRQGSKR
jgi:hypothetical protein